MLIGEIRRRQLLPRVTHPDFPEIELYASFESVAAVHTIAEFFSAPLIGDRNRIKLVGRQ
jgi:hypothetical protein